MLWPESWIRKKKFVIAECNGKLKETEQQNRENEIVSLLEVVL